jgi:lambda repressor-like predicted transcriptional regulator
MGNSGNRFDQCLFDLKLQPLSRKMQAESMVSDRAAIRTTRETCGSLLVKTVDGQLMVLRKWLEGVDQICREVWQTQGEAITPDFVRGTLVPKASELIAARVGTIKSNLEMKVRRGAVQPGNRDVYRANHHLAMEIRKLQAEVANRYEIEARELEHKKARADSTTALSGTGGKPTNAVVSNTREAFLKPILKKTGFSIRAWARKANVDFHTADNYLKGKTKPNPDTLKELADALGVKVEELPV